jgi:hypothetical protein
MMLRAVKIIEEICGHAPRIRKVWKGKKATRWQYWLDIVRKDDLLLVTETLLPELTAKRYEGEAIVWFLKRACADRAYKRTKLDILVLEALASVKRNGGEAPADVRELFREVIPSQATSGHRASGEEVEGVETRGLSPNDNDPHECPAPSLRVMR